MGVAPRRLWGWEPVEETAFEYDSEGRLVRTVTLRESEFTPEQVDLLLAAHLIDIEPRDELGIPISQALDPANEFKWMPPKAPTIDWALKSRDDSRDSYYEKYPDMSRNGHLWRAPTLKG